MVYTKPMEFNIVPSFHGFILMKFISWSQFGSCNEPDKMGSVTDAGPMDGMDPV
jgi:hypothetical protein